MRRAMTAKKKREIARRRLESARAIYLPAGIEPLLARKRVRLLDQVTQGRRREQTFERKDVLSLLWALDEWERRYARVIRNWRIIRAWTHRERVLDIAKREGLSRTRVDQIIFRQATRLRSLMLYINVREKETENFSAAVIENIDAKIRELEQDLERPTPTERALAREQAEDGLVPSLSSGVHPVMASEPEMAKVPDSTSEPPVT
jgi:hypothetical protein